MADKAMVAALVRKRAEVAGRAEHARAELHAMLAGLGALDATLRLFDPTIEVDAIRPEPFAPRAAAAPLGMRARDLLNVLRTAGWPMTAREIATRLLQAKGVAGDRLLLERAVETVAASLRRQRIRGLVACEPGPGQRAVWRLAQVSDPRDRT